MESFWDSSPPLTFANEADVEHQLVQPLLYALGYQTTDIAPKYPVEFREGRAGRKPEADFVCFNGTVHDRNTSLLVVEAKAPNESLTGGKQQGESYAANLRALVLVMTNGSRFEVWQLQLTRESDKVVDIAVRDLIANRGMLENILSRTALINLCNRLDLKSFAKLGGNASSTRSRNMRAPRRMRKPSSEHFDIRQQRNKKRFRQII